LLLFSLSLAAAFGGFGILDDHYLAKPKTKGGTTSDSVSELAVVCHLSQRWSLASQCLTIGYRWIILIDNNPTEERLPWRDWERKKKE
jgi:hypothetical protein